ncbi:hypothetical protein Entas_1867 [Enterobacter soli]|nr:hypothetical protein Entas_1867 [Enterobacter soli]
MKKTVGKPAVFFCRVAASPYPAYGFGRPGKLALPGFTLSERFQNRIHAGFGVAKQHVGVLFEEQRILNASVTGVH